MIDLNPETPNPHRPLEPRSVADAKRRADLLRKDLASGELLRTRAAAERFRALERFRDLGTTEIVAAEPQHKHALEVIAREAGRDDWRSLKARLDKREALRSRGGATPLYPSWAHGWTHVWYARHAEARRHLERAGGYLLPWRGQFFVAEARYVGALGLDPDDPDWEAIGHDWARPADPDARDRLEAKLEAAARE